VPIPETRSVPGIGHLPLFEDPDGRVLGMWKQASHPVRTPRERGRPHRETYLLFSSATLPEPVSTIRRPSPDPIRPVT
jgi:hypothetical protein